MIGYSPNRHTAFQDLFSDKTEVRGLPDHVIDRADAIAGFLGELLAHRFGCRSIRGCYAHQVTIGFGAVHAEVFCEMVFGNWTNPGERFQEREFIAGGKISSKYLITSVVYRNDRSDLSLMLEYTAWICATPESGPHLLEYLARRLRSHS